MPVVAAFVLLACIAFALVVWHRRAGRENTAELDEALARVREELRWRRAVVPGAVLAALVLLAALARNPSRWALLLCALAALAGATIAFVVSERRRRVD
jgi:Na+/H+ antiporter NhaD/arsenite permease-like protein